MASNYTFSTSVPQASQTISSTQAPIESNFQAVSTFINANHVGFYDNVNFGKHTYTSFPIQGSDPATSSTEMALYSKASSDSNGIELFYRYPSSGTVVQLTGGGSGGLAATNGYALITSTLMMKWGIATISTTGSTTVSFPTGGGIPAFTSSVYIVNFTPSANYTQSANGGYINNLTTTTFQFNAPSGGMSSTIYWLALGI